jgi:hypothetical protein
MDGAERSLREQFSGFRPILRNETSLVGWPTARMLYSYNRDLAMKELNVTILIGRGKTTSLLQFICEADAKTFDTLLPVFEAIIASLSIGPDYLRHPEVVLTGLSACTRCRTTFTSGSKVNAVRDLRTGSLDALCDRCAEPKDKP